MKTVSYHPSFNGQAERAVQVFKNGYKKMKEVPFVIICKIPVLYRITLHSTTGSSPAELMFGRNLRSRLDQVQPNVSERVEVHQENQKSAHDNRAHN